MEIHALDLRELIVFLIAAGIVVPVVHRLKVSPILGFLFVGLLIGPYGLARFTDVFPWLSYAVIADAKNVQSLAELGIVFLLFMIGLELSMARLWSMRRLVFGLGGAQVIVTSIVIAAIAMLFENSLPVSVVLGAAFALSSTAIVMEVLADNRRLGTRVGRTGFSILLCQDLAVLPVLFLVTAFTVKNDGSVAEGLAIAIGQAVAAVAIIMVVGRVVIRPLFRFVGNAARREMFLALVLLVIIGTAIATEKAGLSMALGAFLAGLLLAETEYRHEIEVDIEPFKGLLLGLFFISIGMSVDLARVAAAPLLLLSAVIGLFLLKGSVLYGLLRLFREPRAASFEISLLLGQGGEFAFVVLALAVAGGLLPLDTAQFMIVVTALTMMATPPIAQITRRLGRLIEAKDVQASDSIHDVPEDISGHVIVVGYGRIGQFLGSALEAQRQFHIGVDTDASLVAQFRKDGASVYFGDASKPDMLRKLGIEQAAALVVTMDAPQAAQNVVSTARRHWSDLTIYARARDVDHATQLIQLGADHVIPETTEASLKLSEMVLAGTGVPDNAARHLIDGLRQAEQATVDESRT
ncbi:MAG: potassium transporter TrkA [Alphaproteobacteria bacterium]|nr:potassium transporter TrkA [Alphaproteobacteria bacterium]